MWSEIDSQSVLVPMVQARPVVGQVACLHTMTPLQPIRGLHCISSDQWEARIVLPLTMGCPPAVRGPGARPPAGPVMEHWSRLRGHGACHHWPIRGQEPGASANEGPAFGVPNTPASSHARPISHKQTSVTREWPDHTWHDTLPGWLIRDILGKY